jgi:adenosylcobinamide-phosphate synthase
VSVAWWEVAAGVGLDLLVGDPRGVPHPIRGFGWVVTHVERFWRWTGLPLRIAGIAFWISAIGFAGAVAWVTTPWLNMYWIWTMLAIRGLDVEAAAVITQLDRGDLDSARGKLAMIVGRDTADLEEPEIVRAVVETVAENLNDAIVAPMFYLALFGPVGMVVYKAVNTLDSMAGYKNERYRLFGWASARLDDVANFVPARLSAVLVWMSAMLLRYDARRAVRVTLRDGASQPSPNSGYPEAAVAGSIGVRLGGLNYYGGEPSLKAYLGDPVRPLDRSSFGRARNLLYASAVLMTVFVCAVRL